jgi:dTDP-4-dehydrorhamnose 3,5-epimerase
LKFVATEIAGVVLIEPDVFEDARGFFVETYRRDVFRANGIDVDFVQDNHSLSKKGTLRGLHYQIAPKEQAKLVRVVRGEVFDVVVDIRPASKTFGRHVAQTLSAANKKMLFVPAGFAHGYLTLSDEAEFLYKVSEVHSPEHERGLRWDDPALGIAWPKVNGPYTLSEKDKKFPSLREAR